MTSVSMCDLIVSHPQVLLKLKRLKTLIQKWHRKRKRAKGKKAKRWIHYIPHYSHSRINLVWYILYGYLFYSCEGGASTVSCHRVRQSGGVCTSTRRTRRHGKVQSDPWQERDGPRPLPNLLPAPGQREESTTSTVTFVFIYSSSRFLLSLHYKLSGTLQVVEDLQFASSAMMDEW